MERNFMIRNYYNILYIMKKQIMKYYTDKEYYLKMSNRAKERAKILLDTDSEFERIIREAELRETAHTEGDRV